MHTRFISVIAAEPGYFVSSQTLNAWNEPENPWTEWTPVIAWGFDEWGNTTPLTLKGAPPWPSDCRIKAPDGKVI